jgi:type III secretion protein R
MGMMAIAAVIPYLIVVGTCYIKFSVVLVMVRNALGLQQVPSNMVLNAIALILAGVVMQPLVTELYQQFTQLDHPLNSVNDAVGFLDTNLEGYRGYLLKWSKPDLLAYFERAAGTTVPKGLPGTEDHSLFALLPAYALTELSEAFRIGFYLYVPFVVVDLIVSSVLLSLGMMMMSPVTISAPIKLILFVALDGWSMISKGLIGQYMNIGP